MRSVIVSVRSVPTRIKVVKPVRSMQLAMQLDSPVCRRSVSIGGVAYACALSKREVDLQDVHLFMATSVSTGSAGSFR